MHFLPQYLLKPIKTHQIHFMNILEIENTGLKILFPNKSFILVNIHCCHPLFIYDQLDLTSVSYWYVTVQKPKTFFMIC